VSDEARCTDCDHRWTEHAATHPDGCQHRYLNREQCPCTEPAPA
jgi:hypothetical protein